MTFKTTYAFAALVVLASVLAITAAGGFWGTFSYAGIGLGAILTGAILFTLAWRSSRGVIREDPPHAEQISAPFEGYPVNRVLAIFDLERDASAATDELRRVGVHDVSRFAGIEGAVRLDSEGSAHGVTQRIERTIEHVASDVSDLEQYDEAVRLGAIVLGASVPDGTEADRVAEVMRRHRGHEVRFFGQMTTETFSADPTRIRAD